MSPNLNVLKKRSEFLKVAATRKKWVAPAFILQIAPAHEQGSSIGYGLTASKKMVGNAVERNRAKRRLRALICDMMEAHAKPSTNYVFIARKVILTRDYKLLRQDLEKSLKGLKKWQA